MTSVSVWSLSWLMILILLLVVSVNLHQYQGAPIVLMTILQDEVCVHRSHTAAIEMEGCEASIVANP